MKRLAPRDFDTVDVSSNAVPTQPRRTTPTVLFFNFGIGWVAEPLRWAFKGRQIYVCVLFDKESSFSSSDFIVSMTLWNHMTPRLSSERIDVSEPFKTETGEKAVFIYIHINQLELTELNAVSRKFTGLKARFQIHIAIKNSFLYSMPTPLQILSKYDDYSIQTKYVEEAGFSKDEVRKMDFAIPKDLMGLLRSKQATLNSNPRKRAKIPRSTPFMGEQEDSKQILLIRTDETPQTPMEDTHNLEEYDDLDVPIESVPEPQQDDEFTKFIKSRIYNTNEPAQTPHVPVISQPEEEFDIFKELDIKSDLSLDPFAFSPLPEEPIEDFDINKFLF